MKTAKELQKILGVTRKALRVYDEIGLLCPIVKPRGNKPWLYDDNAVQKLLLITIYTEIGGYIRFLLPKRVYTKRQA